MDVTRPTFQVFGHTFTYEQARPRYRGRSLVYLCDSSAAKLRNVNKQQTLIFYQRKLNGRLRLICSIRLQSYAFFLIYANLSNSFFVKDYHAVLFLMVYVLLMDENRCYLVEKSVSFLLVCMTCSDVLLLQKHEICVRNVIFDVSTEERIQIRGLLALIEIIKCSYLKYKRLRMTSPFVAFDKAGKC